MKRTFSTFMALILGIVMIAALSACSGKTAETPKDSNSAPADGNVQAPTDSNQQAPTDDNQQATSETQTTPSNEGAKTLVVYFSVPDNRDTAMWR